MFGHGYYEEDWGPAPPPWSYPVQGPPPPWTYQERRHSRRNRRQRVQYQYPVYQHRCTLRLACFISMCRRHDYYPGWMPPGALQMYGPGPTHYYEEFR